MEDVIKHVSTNLVVMYVNVIKASNSKMTTKLAKVPNNKPYTSLQILFYSIF